jgi:hypothetical protein
VRLSPIEAVWPISETGMTVWAASSRVMCVSAACVLWCWLGLAPRSNSTSVVVGTWQEKLAEVNEWNRVHRPNSWIEFLSAPIHSPLSGSLFRSFNTT